MRCSVSPTTSSVARSALSRDVEVAGELEAMLFAQALKPISDSMGFFGDIAVDARAHA